MAQLFYIYPPEGEPPTNGVLVTESGEEVEGIWVTEVWPESRSDAIQLQFTMVVSALPPLAPERLDEAIQSMIAIHQATGSEFEPKETHHESNEIRDR